jgi:hypothetical protein
MTLDQQSSLDLALDMGMVPINAVAVYCGELNRGSPFFSHSRAVSRTINTINSQLFSLGLQAVAMFRAALRNARNIGVPAAVVLATDAALARQEAVLFATARNTVHLAYAY